MLPSTPNPSLSEEEQFVARLVCDRVLKHMLWHVILNYSDRWESKPNCPVFKITTPVYLSDTNELYDIGMFIEFHAASGLVTPYSIEPNDNFRPNPDNR